MKEFWNFVKDIFWYSINNGVSRHAKALTYSSVLAIVPLLTVFLSSFAKSSWINAARDGLRDIFLENLFPVKITEAIGGHFMTMVESAQSLKTVGMIGFMVIILFLFMDMEDTFGELAHDNVEKKSWYLRVTAIVSLLVVPLLLFAFVGLFEWMLSYSSQVLKEFWHGVFSYSEVLKTAGGLILWGWIYFLYRYLPHRRIKSKCLFMGSLLCVVAIIALQALFSWYLQIFKYYELIYGALSLIPVFLLWVYLMWQVVLHCFVITMFAEDYSNRQLAKEKEDLRKMAVIEKRKRIFPDSFAKEVKVDILKDKINLGKVNRKETSQPDDVIDK